MSDTIRVFISYSWKVQKATIELAERLRNDGIDVVLDVWDLKEGNDKNYFMERSVLDESTNNVLVICDKSYADKANGRQGGVGDETIVISPEVYGQVKQSKAIPVIFEKDDEGKAYVPQYLKSTLYVDLSEETQYEKGYEKLLRVLYNKPIHQKPALGQKPAWLDDQEVNLVALKGIIKQLERASDTGLSSRLDSLIHKAQDVIVETSLKYSLPMAAENEALIEAIDQTKGFRDLFVSFCECILTSHSTTVSALTGVFEKLYNAIRSKSDGMQLSSLVVELREYIVWEFFISATAVLLHYEKFGELHDLLSHTFFLNNYYHDTCEPAYFSSFWKSLNAFEKLEEKQKNNLTTPQGETLVYRECRPMLTKKAIANADLVLFQMGQVLLPKTARPNYWFPISYVYLDHDQPIWRKMVSKEYCKKIMPLFGVSTIDELREKVKLSVTQRNIRHKRDYYDCASGITRWIDTKDIASLN